MERNDTVIGTAKQAAGRVERTAGAALGDSHAELHGAVRELEGAIQRRYGEMTDAAQHLGRGRPIAALLTGAALGLMVGMLLHRR